MQTKRQGSLRLILLAAVSVIPAAQKVAHLRVCEPMTFVMSSCNSKAERGGAPISLFTSLTASLQRRVLIETIG